MSQIPCPKCGRELVRPNPEQSLLSVCLCGFSGCMRDDIADLYQEEIKAEQSERSVLEPVVTLVNDGTLF